MSHDVLEILAEEKKHDETEVGNYFVSNYPPFAYWDAETAKTVRGLLDQPQKPGVPLGVYFHVPFCRKRCHFCYFRVYTDKNADEIKRYLDAGIAELEIYAKSPLIRGRKPRFIYFGGGTPSYLSVAQLKSLTDRMKELLPWDEAEEVAFEAEPGTLNEAKLSAIREIGVTRLSLGVENFDSHILEINGRAHRTDEIYRAYNFARSIGFPQINIDLISGMVEETDENWRENVRKTVELLPDSVTIYQMEVPYNTGIYKEMKAEGKLTAPVANWHTKRGWVDYAFSELEKVGYTVTSGYTAVRDPQKTKFVYRDALWSGADLVGLGVASFSHIAGTHFQNITEFSQYLEAIQRGDLPISRAMTTTEEERMIREFILQMKLGRVNQQYFQEKFGVNVGERFREQFDDLRTRKLISDEGGWIVLTREALLKVDTLLHAFFLPQHRGPRYV
ncbi:oxygen-independent coproporphyrinogen-3 oxidase [Chthoniobacter flavus]|uniref:coproporphyrinogen-III oxidase family protein n=1 Tax=Chthoniobacter flavus TaxID=191863 RepID=UPI0010504073|nr:coproporphyrinogen-III oxidase family protein [Chthoniobacter flavus]TCO92316.1 oxygen-independent coproporphyrinogen-3 oxidase [Chthoniobacter flavus]